VTSVADTKLREVMRRWPSGVSAVTAAVGGRRTGMTVSCFACLTLTPPIVMVSLHKSTETLRFIGKSGRFAVSILRQDQEWISRQLAMPVPPEGDDRLAGIPCRKGRIGAPLILGAAAWIECRVRRTIPLSTHVVVIGHVAACRAGRLGGSPLVYHDRGYRHLR